MRGVLNFAKLHGIGNHFVVYYKARPLPGDDPTVEQIRHLCTPATGVGADGVIAVSAGEPGQSDFRMRMWNPDGSEAQMCGNGIRCLGKFVYDHDITHKTTLAVDTAAGLMILRMTLGADGKVTRVTVDMGPPRFTLAEIPMRPDAAALEGPSGGTGAVAGPGDARDRFIERPISLDLPGAEAPRFTGTAVSMGNPHLVLFHAVSDEELHRLGPRFEHHPWFPQRTNTHFVELRPRGELAVKVWERGAGPTLACGTGACAVAAAAMETGRVPADQPVTVWLPGGPLTIERNSDGHMMMTGPAVEVFTGKLTWPEV